MSKLDKLMLRFKARPKDFTYDELAKMLRGLGYQEIRTGKSAGSRVAFKNLETEHILRLHRPHSLPILKEYLLKGRLLQKSPFVTLSLSKGACMSLISLYGSTSSP